MMETKEEKEKIDFKILTVDDEKLYHKVYSMTLEKAGYIVESADSGLEALTKLESDTFDLVIADQSMPEMDGFELLGFVRKRFPEVGFIFITGRGSIESAVKAIKMGADDYLNKPVDRDILLFAVKSTLEKMTMARELCHLKGHLLEHFAMDNLVGHSRAMQKLFQTIRKVAESEATILLQGDSGTGKELLAKSIHFNSPRRNNPLVTIDCGSMPLELLQSELFGHIKGSFTGAVKTRRGLFEEARGGTIFLDEIGEIPEPLQLGLLRVLQERVIRPIGSDKTIPIDVRVISASNRNLKEAVEKGHFRRDLFYRLAVITLDIPPLRERREDIPYLIKFFLSRYNKRNSKNVLTVSQSATNMLYSYRWEGNVRELENVIERAVVLAETDNITPDLLPEEIYYQPPHFIIEDELSTLKQISNKASATTEKNAILIALKKCEGNKKKAADMLGISRASLYNKIKSYGID